MRKHYPAAFAAALVALAAARAWTCDDAFITFRVVEQLLGGAGPVFNEGERVQVFTHPLWLFVLAAWRATGASLFPGVMVLSVALFAIGLGLLCAAFRDKPWGLTVAFVAMFLCRPIMDFATGGLETPATFLLFCAALWALRGARPRTALALLALLPLDRLDLLPWALPFAWLCSRPGWRSRVATLAAYCAPAAAWMAFSTVYYGSPLPNTALAKLGGPLPERLDAGLAYVVGSAANDAGALALLAAAPALAWLAWRRNDFAARDRRLAAACAIAGAYGLAYPMWTGGDFMLGRFLLPALWAFAALLALSFPAAGEPRRRLAAASSVLALLAATHLVTGQSTTLLWLDLDDRSMLRAVGFQGATDERRVYVPWLGAYARHRAAMVPDGLAPTASPRMVATLGQSGYLAARRQAVVDSYSLADPFMARVKALPHPRPGHAFRPYPPEWPRWREPDHHFDDSRLDTLAAELRLVHRSPNLWSAARWRAMWSAFFTAPIDLGVFSVRDEGVAYRIKGVPSRIYRPFAAPSYLIWARQYDPGRLKYGMALPRGLDAQCLPIDVDPVKGDTTAFTVPFGEAFDLRCVKDLLGGDGILLRIGAWMNDYRGLHVEYDQPIYAVRPALSWISGVPGWLVQGWNEAPEHAMAVACVLVTAAGLLALKALARSDRASRA